MASPVASAALKARVRRPSLLNKLAHPDDLIQHFPNGAYVGWSGFTGVGYPKCVSSILFASTGQLEFHAIGVIDINTINVVGRSLLCWRTMLRRTVCRVS